MDIVGMDYTMLWWFFPSDFYPGLGGLYSLIGRFSYTELGGGNTLFLSLDYGKNICFNGFTRTESLNNR